LGRSPPAAGEVNAVWLGKDGILIDAPNAPRTGDTLYVSLAASVTF
jgi:hypothetical protein